MSRKRVVKFRDYKSYFALLIIGIIIALALVVDTKTALTGHSIAEASTTINTIALEDGADADVIIAAADFASDHYITETMLTSELSGAEANTLIVKNIGADTTTITKSGTNLVLEGDPIDGFSAISLMDSSYYDTFAAYDVVQVLDGSVIGVTPAVQEAADVSVSVSQGIAYQIVADSSECTDSDYGFNVYELGTAADSFDDDWYGPRQYGDECIVYMSEDGAGYQSRNSCQSTDIRCSVREGYCTDQGYYTIDDIECPNGCAAGVCLLENGVQCTDSDHGYGPSVAGTTNARDGSHEDVCVGSTLEEGYCDYDSGTLKTGEEECLYGCEAGACLAAPDEDCTDSDGYDIYTAGRVADSFDDDWYGPREYADACIAYVSTTGAGYQSRDPCGPNDIRCSVREGYCTDEGYYSIDDVECPNGCENGACVGGDTTYQPICGDSIVEDTETCDDGNTADGDGCTAACTIEVKEGCWETDTGVAGTYSGYYYDWDYYYYGEYGSSQQEYSYDYAYDNYCYYYDYYGAYYYADYYCSQSTYDNKWYASSTWDQCPSGCDDKEGCLDVETVEPSCTETDSGKDQDVAGVTTLINKFAQERTAEDTCYSWSDDYQYVVENYCYDDGTNYYLYTDYIVCDGVCQNGACVAAAYTPTCDDSDSTEIYEYDWQKSASTLGAVSGNDKSGTLFEKEDYCYDSYGYGYVVEQYCNEKDARYETYVFCPGGCEEGVCVKPDWEQSCEDSDATTTNAGRDVYTIGTASGIDYYGKDFAYTDYCYYSSWDKTHYVVDYYCAESSYSGVYASSYWDSCPDGCENGACIAEETTSIPTCFVGDKSVSGADAYGASYTYYDYCNGAETLVTYSCGTDGVPTATETACNCVDSQCHTASMTVAEFISSVNNPVIVIGSGAATEDNIAAIDLAGAYGWKVVTDATISDPTIGIYVAIGGPYANKVSEAAFGGQVWDYGAGEALFLVKEHDTDGKTLVISGSEAIDTRNAVALLVDNPESLTDVYVVKRVS